MFIANRTLKLYKKSAITSFVFVFVIQNKMIIISHIPVVLILGYKMYFHNSLLWVFSLLNIDIFGFESVTNVYAKKGVHFGLKFQCFTMKKGSFWAEKAVLCHEKGVIFKLENKDGHHFFLWVSDPVAHTHATLPLIIVLCTLSKMVSRLL